METELITLISNVGFPIAVAAFLLLKHSQELTALGNHLDNINATLAKQTEIMQQLIALSER
ncbi:MAG: YvrJ family protein [Candidatus Aenigmarchaeota archaeon]|nr:YvrJ family protein [Candidatus Aenigmarchaeota archaeon]